MWLCIRFNNASLSGPAIDLQNMPILAQKKIIFSDEAHFDLGTQGTNMVDYTLEQRWEIL